MDKQRFKKEFAVFILSHGRADDLKTAKMLKNGNYTGDWFVVIDDEDNQEDTYRRLFKKRVIQFNKRKQADITDTGDLDNDRRVGVFARNKIQELARERGYKYHLQLDDDMTSLSFRLPQKGKIGYKNCTHLDDVFYSLVEFMETAPQVKWLSFGLSSDYIGGLESERYKEGLLRKTMGTFLMRADAPAEFVMRMNDDITTCVLNNHRGAFVASVTVLQIQTPATQHQKGGMTDIYQDNGTYRKSFYSVMCAPSCTKVSKQGIRYFRIHHEISWNNCCPLVLSERYKK